MEHLSTLSRRTLVGAWLAAKQRLAELERAGLQPGAYANLERELRAAMNAPRSERAA